MRSGVSPAGRAAREVGRAGPVPRLLVPGWPHWSWRQTRRAWALFGTYIAAVGVGLFAWGDLISVVVLTFAFSTHVVSASDALRQAAFPGHGRWVPLVSATAGLGIGYVPVVGALWLLAWPGTLAETDREGFLIDRSAYRHRLPRPGDWVWLDRLDRSGGELARVWGTEFQELERRDGRLWADGRLASWQPPLAPRALTHFRLNVPRGHVLIERLSAGLEGRGLALVAQDEIAGRAWAQYRPIWSRRLLDNELDRAAVLEDESDRNPKLPNQNQP